MIADADLAALCLFEEAGNQPFEGKVAVAVVILRRTANNFFSNGTISGTILAHDQFSWTEWAMVGGHYTQVAFGPEEQAARCEKLLDEAQANEAKWADCQHAWALAQAAPGGEFGGQFAGGPEYQKLLAATGAMQYVNLEVLRPDWATPDKLVAKIFAHSFYNE